MVKEIKPIVKPAPPVAPAPQPQEKHQAPVEQKEQTPQQSALAKYEADFVDLEDPDTEEDDGSQKAAQTSHPK